MFCILSLFFQCIGLFLDHSSVIYLAQIFSELAEEQAWPDKIEVFLMLNLAFAFTVNIEPVVEQSIVSFRQDIAVNLPHKESNFHCSELESFADLVDSDFDSKLIDLALKYLEFQFFLHYKFYFD